MCSNQHCKACPRPQPCMGAAGGGVELAELLCAEGYIDKAGAAPLGTA